MNPLQDQMGHNPKLPKKFSSRTGNKHVLASCPHLYLQIKWATIVLRRLACIHVAHRVSHLFLSKKRVASCVLLIMITLLHAVSVFTLCLGKSAQNIAKQLDNHELA